MLAFTDPVRLAGLAQPAPWRVPGPRTAGLIQAGIARILREIGRSAFIAAIWEKIDAAASSTSGSSAPLADKAAQVTHRAHHGPGHGPQPRRHEKEMSPGNYSLTLNCTYFENRSFS